MSEVGGPGKVGAGAADSTECCPLSSAPSTASAIRETPPPVAWSEGIGSGTANPNGSHNSAVPDLHRIEQPRRRSSEDLFAEPKAPSEKSFASQPLLARAVTADPVFTVPLSSIAPVNPAPCQPHHRHLPPPPSKGILRKKVSSTPVQSSSQAQERAAKVQFDLTPMLIKPSVAPGTTGGGHGGALRFPLWGGLRATEAGGTQRAWQRQRGARWTGGTWDGHHPGGSAIRFGR